MSHFYTQDNLSVFPRCVFPSLVSSQTGKALRSEYNQMAKTNWAFNMDTASVESRRPDGTVHAIDTLAVEREFVETWLDRRGPDYLICNDSAAYAEPVLAGDVKGYLDTARRGQ